MATPADTETTGTTVEVKSPILPDWERFGQLLKEAKDDAEKINERLAKGGDAGIKIVDEKEVRVLSRVIEGINVSTKSMETLQSAARKSFAEFKKIAITTEIKNLDDSKLKAIYNQFTETGKSSGDGFGFAVMKGAEGWLKSMASNLSKEIGKLSALFKQTGLRDAAHGAGLIAGAELQQGIAQSMNKVTGGRLFETQNLTMPLEKAAYQSALNFGNAFRDLKLPLGSIFIEGGKAMGQFTQRTIQASNVTKRSIEEVTKTHQELAAQIGFTAAQQAIDPGQSEELKRYTSELKEQGVSLTQNTASLLLSNATGINSSNITKMMGDAQQQLGESVNDVIPMFGRIADASKKSGIGMDKTGQSIMNAALSLKMWGGSVASVTPLFNMFSESIARGQKGMGLAPELFEKFVGGINNMSFATRAFIGTQTGMGGRGGALGAGLKMEEALEDKTGKGMQQVVSNLAETIKQIGGGKIVTRKEAMETPGLQATFLMQRQLLGQMTGISGTAEQTRMLEALGEVGVKSGISTEKAADEMALMMKAGQKVASETTTIETEAANEVKNSLIVGSKYITKAAELWAERLGVKTEIKNVQHGLEKSQNLGKIDIDAIGGRIAGFIQSITGKLPKIIKEGGETKIPEAMAKGALNELEKLSKRPERVVRGDEAAVSKGIVDLQNMLSSAKREEIGGETNIVMDDRTFAKITEKFSESVKKLDIESPKVSEKTTQIAEQKIPIQEQIGNAQKYILELAKTASELKNSLKIQKPADEKRNNESQLQRIRTELSNKTEELENLVKSSRMPEQKMENNVNKSRQLIDATTSIVNKPELSKADFNLSSPIKKEQTEKQQTKVVETNIKVAANVSFVNSKLIIDLSEAGKNEAEKTVRNMFVKEGVIS